MKIEDKVKIVGVSLVLIGALSLLALIFMLNVWLGIIVAALGLIGLGFIIVAVSSEQ